MRDIGRRLPLTLQRRHIGIAVRERFGDAADVDAVLDNVDPTLTFGENVEVVERAIGCRLRDPCDLRPGDLRAIRAMEADYRAWCDYTALTADLSRLSRRDAVRWARLYARFDGREPIGPRP